MTAMANIVVKANDGTTDVTYTQQNASGGDKSPAIWRELTVGAAPAHRTFFAMVAQDNGQKTARRVSTNYVLPYLVTGSDGRIVVADRCIIQCSGVLPNGMPSALTNEAIAQCMNLHASALIKLSFQSGYAPV
jgi:hypothetical protein